VGIRPNDFMKKVARTVTKRILRNPNRSNERAYDNFMEELTPAQRKKVLSDTEVKINIKKINKLGGLR
jgi:hypothetical protein